MVSTSEGVVYYCTVILTALIFLTEASAITTNYEKTDQNETADLREISPPQRTKLAATRGRSLSKNQNQDRVSPITPSKLKSNGNSELAPRQLERELLSTSNSGGETDIKDKGGGKVDDDDQKTLSQQVADGKYGLIQNEIFAAKPDRPGILSYDINPEVPKDNVYNFGGLEPDDIWLAENHLLVLAGANAFNGLQTQWKPIDNYEAPKRPVKIPSNPKVPPPFPIQLNENGPVEYVHGDRVPMTPPQFSPFYNPFIAPYYNKTPQYGPATYDKYPPNILPPPQSQHNPSYPHTLVKPLPGAEFIPPYLGNLSDTIDEDDPSLYYPPPYDFVYSAGNTSKVPPGPLVPGLVLPPPPDFFSAFVDKDATSKDTAAKSDTAKSKYKSHYAYKSGKQLQYPSTETDDQKRPHYENEPPSSIPHAGRLADRQPMFVNSNEIINEITYPELKDDKITYSDAKASKLDAEHVNDGWIPIPAPKPYYITGFDNAIKNSVLVMMDALPVARQLHKTGYAYEKPRNAFKIFPPDETTVRDIAKLPKYAAAPEYRTTTPISPQIVSTKPSDDRSNEIFTTTPIAPSDMYRPPPAKSEIDTIKATYYFYEEPRFVDNLVPVTVYPNPSISTPSSIPPSTSPIVAFENTPKPTPVHEVFPSLVGKPSSTEDAFNSITKKSKSRKLATPIIPIYYLAELDNIVDLIKPMNLPSYQVPQTSKNTFYTTTSKPNYDRQTPRPIFEYSYVASDYSGGSSTPQPVHDYRQPNYPAHVDYNAAFFDQPSPPQRYPPEIFNSVAQFGKPPTQTTVTPILDAFLDDEKPLFSSQANAYEPADQSHKNGGAFNRPWIPTNVRYNQPSYPTENPFYAFFTKEDEDLIDDNTKKYFSIFGQKIKHSVESTSPISVVQTVALPTTTRWNTKYHRQSYSQPPSRTNYSDRPVDNYRPNYYASSTTTPPSYSAEYTTIKSRYKSPTTSSHATAEETQKLPISLEGDVLVNYVTPITENPDAEYVPHKISKHIRPIVVEDLPSDVNERLKNLMDAQRHQSSSSSSSSSSSIYDKHKTKKKPPNQSANKYRYVLIDSQHDDGNVHYRPYNEINVYDKRGRPTHDEQYTGSYSSNTREITSTMPAVSLENDIRVNYQSNKLAENPDAEYVRTASEYSLRENSDEDDIHATKRDDDNKGRRKSSQAAVKPISLENDILVNYKNNKDRYTLNPDAEYIGSGGIGKTSAVKSSSNIIAYDYPGVEHGHFYFLPPQETHLSQIEDERYDFQSDVENPSGYFKRVPRKLDNRATKAR